MNQTITSLKREYTTEKLHKATVDPDPFLQFHKWFTDAQATDLIEPEAVTLATATTDGRPSARMVLMKGFDEQGFVFYTNYGSRKGQELTANPWAALVFWWPVLHRQVRIEGPVSQVAAEESDAYFASRPNGSRLGAWVSQRQSEVINGRFVLEERLQSLQAQFETAEIPRPPYWGGYRVQPLSFEFWQGGVDRLHDRLRYTRQADTSWLMERLSP
jgi:pyridoxamine 5'-phosphate oxidase